jgi:hypothetical protein
MLPKLSQPVVVKYYSNFSLDFMQYSGIKNITTLIAKVKNYGRPPMSGIAGFHVFHFQCSFVPDSGPVFENMSSERSY